MLLVEFTVQDQEISDQSISKSRGVHHIGVRHWMGGIDWSDCVKLILNATLEEAIEVCFKEGWLVWDEWAGLLI